MARWVTTIRTYYVRVFGLLVWVVLAAFIVGSGAGVTTMYLGTSSSPVSLCGPFLADGSIEAVRFQGCLPTCAGKGLCSMLGSPHTSIHTPYFLGTYVCGLHLAFFSLPDWKISLCRLEVRWEGLVRLRPRITPRPVGCVVGVVRMLRQVLRTYCLYVAHRRSAWRGVWTPYADIFSGAAVVPVQGGQCGATPPLWRDPSGRDILYLSR